MKRAIPDFLPRKVAFLFFVLLYWIVPFTHSLAAGQESHEVSSNGIVLPNSTLLYVSDYLSFVGEDDQGYVTFALDTNRGRDGESYQAEHFVVLHDEHQGWINVEGNGQYNNDTHELLSIPDSQAFQFQGTPTNGWTIISHPNQLTLTVEPVPERLSQSENGGQFWMGSSPATMVWRDRTLKGRVIYEFILMPDFNRLTRTYWALWNEFQGFYLSVDGLGALYLHSQESELIAPLIGKLNGFLAVNDKTNHFQVLQLTTVDLSQGFGFYKWPNKWVAGWSSEKGSGTAQLELSQFNQIANWLIGGFAMGIVRGQVTYNGKVYQVYGLVELIM